MSRLDETVTFHARLTDAQTEAMAALPGVNPWSAGRVESPLNAWVVVRDLLTRWDVPATWVDPKPIREPSRETVMAAAAPSELHPWLWESDATRRPTAGFAITEYQEAAIRFGSGRAAAHLWMPPGSGKTIVAMVLAMIKPGPILIVTKAGARHVHDREIRRCSTALPHVCKPSGERRKGDLDLDGYLTFADTEGIRPIVICGWEQTADLLSTLSAVRFQTVVWDESHKGKHRRREKWVLDRDGRPEARDLGNTVSACYQLARAIPRRFATTATAVRNLLQDLYMQLCLVEPRAWGRTASKFEARYCDAKQGEAGYWQAKGTSNIPELVHRLSYGVYRVPFAVVAAQLPPKRRMVLRIDPGQLVKPLAREKDEVQAERESEKRGGRERKLADAASAKRQAVYDLVAEHLSTGKGKILVFSGRRRDVEFLGAEIERRLKIKVWASHGGDPPERRREIEREYMGTPEKGIPPHPGPCVLVGSVDAWGESLNLQDTDVLICAMLPDTAGQVDQMEGRGYRIGMGRPYLVLYPIAADTYDEYAAGNLINKLVAIEGVASSGSVMDLRDSLRGLDRREEILAGLASVFGDDNEGDQMTCECKP